MRLKAWVHSTKPRQRTMQARGHWGEILYQTQNLAVGGNPGGSWTEPEGGRVQNRYYDNIRMNKAAGRGCVSRQEGGVTRLREWSCQSEGPFPVQQTLLFLCPYHPTPRLSPSDRQAVLNDFPAFETISVLWGGEKGLCWACGRSGSLSRLLWDFHSNRNIVAC